MTAESFDDNEESLYEDNYVLILDAFSGLQFSKLEQRFLLYVFRAKGSALKFAWSADMWVYIVQLWKYFTLSIW